MYCLGLDSAQRPMTDSKTDSFNITSFAISSIGVCTLGYFTEKYFSNLSTKMKSLPVVKMILPPCLSLSLGHFIDLSFANSYQLRHGAKLYQLDSDKNIEEVYENGVPALSRNGAYRSFWLTLFQRVATACFVLTSNGLALSLLDKKSNVIPKKFFIPVQVMSSLLACYIAVPITQAYCGPQFLEENVSSRNVYNKKNEKVDVAWIHRGS